MESLQGRGMRRVVCSIEIEADSKRVFSEWTRFENLPHIMAGVRQTQQIGPGRILWDADVAGRQVVWEAEIIEQVPHKRIRWESRWGACHAGTVSFDELPDGRTLLTADVHYRPSGLMERIGARFDLLGLRIRRDLAQFRRFVESLPRDVVLS